MRDKWGTGVAESNPYAPIAVSQNIEDPILKTRLLIIALTDYAMQGEKQKCLNADMDDYISNLIGVGPSQYIESIVKPA